MNRLLELEKELARFSGRGAKPNAPAPVPVEPSVSAAQSYHWQEPTIRIVNAMSNFPFDPNNLFEVEYIVQDGDTLESVVANHYRGFAPADVAKAIEYHRKQVGLKGGPLTAGTTIKIYCQSTIAPVVVTARRFMDRTELLRRLNIMMTGIYNAQASALNRLESIIWWPKDYSDLQKDYLLEVLKSSIAAVLGEVKGLMPLAIKLTIDSIFGVFSKEIEDAVQATMYPSPKVSEKEFAFVSRARSRLDQLNMRIPKIVEATTAKYLDQIDKTPNADQRSLISDKMADSIELISNRLGNAFRVFLQLWEELCRQLYKDAHLRIDLKGISGPGDLGYCGFDGIPREKVNLVNHEINEVFRNLNTGYIGYHEMRIPVKIYVNSLGPLHISAGKTLLKNHHVVFSYLNTPPNPKGGYGKDEPNVVYFFPYKLYGEFGGVTTQEDCRLPFPAKLTVN